ncbi:uncharacterized protein Gasu_15300 [Galdieria sulphuraria]|uniref:Zinc-finger domain-containing protein n=1 Tax=Galdieria sulphuraria TaxID=130081 RepID=M2W6A6_GALSU|nr:uncharacterized protein Gasu_15300 [Galdieria sulphuraria]EME31291.1 hypothetical protein Gasu_15300 [Galdieria sulphuraria]|eukprot:XP_005707811.1 hypothetical protein Gasu_15300 [Galdieria sulphuraria]
MVLFEFEEDGLMSVDDGIFDFVRFEDEWPKEFSWEESNLFRTGPEKSIQGLENIFESSESDIRHHLLGASKMEYEQGSNTTVEDYFSRNFEPRTSTTQTPELVASPSNKLLGVSPEESFKSCLKTDFQGRKHYHGLYALDAVEKSFSLSPPAGLWTHTTSLKSFEQQNSPFNDTPTLSCRQSTQETQFSTPFNSREFSNMNIMPSSPLSSSSKRFKSASNESKMSFNVEVLFPAMGSTFHENDQERSSIGSKVASCTHSVHSDQSSYSGGYRKFRVPDPILSPALESQIKRRPQRKKQYSRVSPAKFCHLCARAASKNIRMIVCSNIQIGMCLKVTCEKCFQQNNWNFEEAIGNPDSWICTHCRGSCPYRAQCSIYQRTNHRRRVSRFLMKKQKELNEDYST